MPRSLVVALLVALAGCARPDRTTAPLPTTSPPVAARPSEPLTSAARGDVEVRVLVARVGRVACVDMFGHEGRSNNPLLSVEIEIVNKSETRKIDYRTWGQDPDAIFRADSKLTDDLGNDYKPIAIENASVTGATMRGSCYPGKSLRDVLVFEPPVARAAQLKLELPTQNIGIERDQTGPIVLKIPQSAIAED